MAIAKEQVDPTPYAFENVVQAVAQARADGKSYDGIINEAFRRNPQIANKITEHLASIGDVELMSWIGRAAGMINSRSYLLNLQLACNSRAAQTEDPTIANAWRTRAAQWGEAASRSKRR